MTQDFRDREIKQVHPSMVLWLGGMTVIKHTGIWAVQIINCVIFFFFLFREKSTFSLYIWDGSQFFSLFFKPTNFPLYV